MSIVLRPVRKLAKAMLQRNVETKIQIELIWVVADCQSMHLHMTKYCRISISDCFRRGWVCRTERWMPTELH